jgi:succinate-semialdehyde dehydrogenase / glutarate-semialdehyde dehydrogenase
MSAPPAAVFDRLRKLVAIADPGSRESKTITEVFTGKDLTTIPIGTADDVAAAFDRARQAQGTWARRPVKERCAIIDRFRKLLIERRDFLMDVAQAESGKARYAAQEDVFDMIANAHYYAREAADLLAPKRVQGLLPGIVKTVVNYHPKGVVGVIAPWNYPMALSISDSIPALLAGNAVVVKPDSMTPFSTLAAAEVLYEAGLPQELYAVVPGPGSVVGSAIVEHCDYLMFTGSSATGASLAEQCGRRLIGFSAELGGKNPMIVTKGADLSKAATAALRACFSNAGQLCIAIERIYVERAVADEFIAEFVKRTKNMKLATSYDFSVDMGSMISEDQMKNVVGHIEDAKAKGAKVLAGGNLRPDIGPMFLEPTILTDVTDDMDLARDETFGPVVSIYPVDDVEEAIDKANDSEYGLNASVWAGSKAEGEAIAARLQTGTVNVDECYALSFGSTAAPMGGMKSSGLGRRHGPGGLLKYVESQTVSTARVMNLDPPPGIPKTLWQKALIPMVQVAQAIPGR